MTLRSDGKHAIEVRGVAVKMHWNNANGAWRDERLDLLHVHAIGLVDVDEDRNRAAMNHWFHRRKRCVRWHDDLVARTQSLREVQQIDDERPRRAEDGVFGAGVGGKLSLERLALLAQNVLAGAQCAQCSLFDFGVNQTFGERDFLHEFLIGQIRRIGERRNSLDYSVLSRVTYFFTSAQRFVLF